MQSVQIVRSVLVVFLAIQACGAHAGDAHVSDQLVAEIAKREHATPAAVRESLDHGCDSGVTASMRQCGYYHWVGADIQLNRTYEKLDRKLGDTPAKVKLAKAERAWIAFRDATCDYETDGWSNGSGASVVYQTCLETLTEDRNKKLMEYLQCNSDDCPGNE